MVDWLVAPEQATLTLCDGNKQAWNTDTSQEDGNGVHVHVHVHVYVHVYVYVHVHTQKSTSRATPIAQTSSR
jgi:hypothetical protein